MSSVNDQKFPNLIYEAIAELGVSSDPKAIAERVKHLSRGLPAEDEFSMILRESGKCSLVHKLDQYQSPPESKEYYRVPDLLVIFDHQGHKIPTLIEIKYTKGETLKWRVDYFESLKRYGEVLKLPMLVAWKQKSLGGLWTLFELRHFKPIKKNYRITWKDSLKENLMGVLVGDFAIVLKKGVGLHIKMWREEKIKEDQKEGIETWKTRIEEVYFTNSEGEYLKRINNGLFIFLFSAKLEEKQTIEGRQVNLHFVISEEQLVWAHQAFVNYFSLLTNDSPQPFIWRELLQKDSVPFNLSTLKKAAKEGISQKIVRCGLHQIPNQKPDILEK